MKENEKVSFIYSWPVIILALFFFWPLGLFLIIRRVAIDKTFALRVGKLIGFAGIVSYVIAIVGLISGLADGFGPGDGGLIFFFGLAGFVLRKVAKKIKTNADSVKQYLSIIVNGSTRQLDSIAAITGRSYDMVKKDIQKMIQKGYLKNAYIDEASREVVLPTSRPAPAVEEVPVSSSAASIPAPAAEKPVTKIVSCPCCGANNTVVGDIGECEYCGSPLE